MSEIADFLKEIRLGSIIEITLKDTHEKIVGRLEKLAPTSLTLILRSTGLPYFCKLEKIDICQQMNSNGQTHTSVGTRRTNDQKRQEASRSGQHSSSLQSATTLSPKHALHREGETLYQEARRIIDRRKDREQAIPLLIEAIEKHEKPDRVIRQLISLYFLLNRHDEIIPLLESYKGLVSTNYRQTMLSEVFWQTKRYRETIKPLAWTIKHLGETASPSKRAYMYQQMGICYLKIEELEEAREWFEKILEISEGHIGATKNLAFCLLKRGNYDKALEKLRSLPPDTRITELIEDIEHAHALGQTPQEAASKIFTDEIEISTETTSFSDFFLEHCTYRGIPPEKGQEKSFVNSDANRPEELGKKAGIKNPQERAEYYLTAAKVLFESKEEPELDRAYSNLCRSFDSWGDEAVQKQKSLETACTWYGEALRVYGGDEKRGDDEVARFSLIRFLYASAGKHEAIPLERENAGTIPHAFADILATHEQPERIFQTIIYLMARSQYAANLLSYEMYHNRLTRLPALFFLQQGNPNAVLSSSNISSEDFARHWQEQQEEWEARNKAIIAQFHSMQKIKLTNTSSVTTALKQIEDITPQVFFHLDKEYLSDLQKILERIQTLSQAMAFETAELLRTGIEQDCKALLKKIEHSPTLLSIEQIHPIVSLLEQQTQQRRNEILANFSPKINLYIPDGMSFQTLTDQRIIEVPIFVANQAGCGPANSLKLSINPEPAFFESLNQETKLESSLQGGKTTSIPVSLLMTEEAVRDKIFSLSVSLSYRTYMADICTLGPLDFSIQLGATEEFQRIPNPYDASGGVARQGRLFYGRDAFIEKIIDVIDNPGIQHKSIVIYGQMRSGKTSILQHLLPRLEERNSHILAANLESVGGYQNIGGASIFTKLLWDILQSGIQEAIQRKIDKGFSPLALELPSAPEEFFHNPAPERYFISIVKNFLRHADTTPGWEQTRIILGLDEFQYIYGYMQNGNLPPEFMIYWKALLQENLLSTILVGQDVMPKFIERYSNEFGVMEKFPVTYLSEEHAKRLIDEPIFINGKSRYREQEAIDSIFQLTAGNPYYIQIICSRLVEHLNEKKHPYITRAHVKNVCESLMKGNQKLHSEFDNLIMSGDPSNEAIPREDARAVLKNIARESRGDGYCPREEINCQTTRPIDNILEDLYVRKVVEKHERFFNKESQKSHYDYKIIVELYKEWLLANA